MTIKCRFKDVDRQVLGSLSAALSEDVLGTGVSSYFGTVDLPVGTVLVEYVDGDGNWLASDNVSGALTSLQDERLSNLNDAMIRQLGLMMENHVECDIVRNAKGLKTSSTFYLYDSKAHALTHNKSTGLITTYTVAITYDGNNRMSLFKVVKND